MDSSWPNTALSGGTSGSARHATDSFALASSPGDGNTDVSKADFGNTLGLTFVALSPDELLPTRTGLAGTGDPPALLPPPPPPPATQSAATGVQIHSALGQLSKHLVKKGLVLPIMTGDEKEPLRELSHS